MACACAMIAASAVVSAALTTAVAMIGPTRMGWSLPLWLLNALVLLVAVWLLGSPEPALLKPPRVTTWVIRMGAIVLLSALAFSLLPIATGWFGGADFMETLLLITTAVDAAVTFVAWRHLAGLARRGDHVRIARNARLFAWAVPALAGAQVVIFRVFRVSPGFGWFLDPDPLIGEPRLIALVPMSIVYGENYRPSMIFWFLAAVTSVAAVVTLARLAVIFVTAARTERTA
jgi:hypothetical protein